LAGLPHPLSYSWKVLVKCSRLGICFSGWKFTWVFKSGPLKCFFYDNLICWLRMRPHHCRLTSLHIVMIAACRMARSKPVSPTCAVVCCVFFLLLFPYFIFIVGSVILIDAWKRPLCAGLFVFNWKERPGGSDQRLVISPLSPMRGILVWTAFSGKIVKLLE
jgi:hypothetical protein